MTRSETPAALAALINNMFLMSVTPKQVECEACLAWDLAEQRATTHAEFRAELEANLVKVIEVQARFIIRQRVEAKF